MAQPLLENSLCPIADTNIENIASTNPYISSNLSFHPESKQHELVEQIRNRQ